MKKKKNIFLVVRYISSLTLKIEEERRLHSFTCTRGSRRRWKESSDSNLFSFFSPFCLSNFFLFFKNPDRHTARKQRVHTHTAHTHTHTQTEPKTKQTKTLDENVRKKQTNKNRKIVLMMMTKCFSSSFFVLFL